MKKALVWALAVMLILGLAGCGKEEVTKLNIGSGSKAGIYFSYAGVLGQLLKDHTDLAVTVSETEGSMANIQGIAAGDYQLGILQSDVMSYAWQGRRSFDGARVDSLRAVASLYTEPIQLVAVNPEIHYVDELRGMRVAVGLPGSGILFNAMDILEAVSLSLEEIQPQYLSPEDTMSALEEGTVDAAFLVTGCPSPILRELAETVDFHLVSIEGPVAERVLTSCPFYTVHTVPAGTYACQPQKVSTLAVRAVLVVSARESSQTVYEITKTIFENLSPIRSCNPMGRELTPETVALGVTIPFHAGAEKYYNEQDISLRKTS